MRNLILGLLACSCLFPELSKAQGSGEADTRIREIYDLIASYSLARETQDSLLLKRILTADMDQLVSSGEWRKGIDEAMQGMQRSSEANPGTRTLTVEQLRFLGSKCAIADARYEIRNSGGSTRSMWSTFVVIRQQGRWKIAAIRNMLPSG